MAKSGRRGGKPEMTDDGSIADLPWASVFDPATNARVLGSVQARGFRAATEVVNRLVQLADQGLADASTTTPAAKPGGLEGPQSDESPQPDVDRILAGWQKLVGQLAQSLAATVRAPENNRVTMDFADSSASGQVELAADQPGAVSTEVWLHNGGSIDMGKIRLRCSDLLAHDGAVVCASSVRFEPDAVPMFARSSRGITMQIDVMDEVRPGHYRGTLLADGHEDVWLPVLLVVGPPSS
jgi:hypothetical protein